MKSKRRIILIAGTIALVGALLLCVDYSTAVDALKRAEWGYILAAAGLTLLFPLLCAIRWHLIVLQLGCRLGVWESYKIVMAAWPLGTITPAKSGDLVKVLFLKNVLPYSKTTGVILAERMMDVVVLCVYSLAGGWIYGFTTAFYFCGAILAGVIVFFLLSASSLVQWVPERWRELVENLLEASKRICLNRRSFLTILSVTFLNWMLSFVQTWICYCAFHAEVPFVYVIAALPIAIFIGLAPVTLSGAGTRDGAIIYLFQHYASYEISLSVGILYSIFGYWLLSLLGVPFMKAAFQDSIGGIHGKDLRRYLHPQNLQESEEE
ncbi:MAG: lysylphosphatidylglycerol synthase transmembrane domain-containing protein [Candidatus Omnitrophota bacterium]